MSARYCQKTKEKIKNQNQNPTEYQNIKLLPKKEKKNRKWEYGFKEYKNLFVNEKQGLVEYRKKVLWNVKKIFHNHLKEALTLVRLDFLRMLLSWGSIWAAVWRLSYLSIQTKAKNSF